MSNKLINNNDSNFETKNNPRIISNKLDQAPKTGEHYQKRIDEMHDQLMENLICNLSFDEGENPKETEKIVSWLEKNQKKVPLYRISKELLQNKGKKISFLLAKEKIKDIGRHTMIGPLLPIDNITYNNLGTAYGDKLDQGEIGTYITFEDSESGQIKLSLHQIEIGGRLTMKGTGCHKNITFEEFEKALGKDSEDIELKQKNEADSDPKKENSSSLGNKLKKIFK